MAFPKKHLYNTEEVVLDLHPHWWFLVPTGLGLVGAMVLGGLALGGLDGDSTWVDVARWGAALLVLVALVAFLVRLVRWKTTEFVVTTDRCIYRSGVFAKKGIEIPLDRISTVFFNQSIFERMIGAGDIGIESAGEGSRQNFSDIMNPVAVQTTIYAQMEEYENRRQDRQAAATQVAAGAQLSVPEQIEKLDELRARGAITDAEFEAHKAKLFGQA